MSDSDLDLGDFIALGMNTASSLVSHGKLDEAQRALDACSRAIIELAGDQTLDALANDLKAAFDGRFWLSETSVCSTKVLIRDDLALMIARADNLVEASGKRLSKLGVLDRAEDADDLRILARDAALFRDYLEEALECIGESGSQFFSETVLKQMNDMELAFEEVHRSTDEHQ